MNQSVLWWILQIVSICCWAGLWLFVCIVNEEFLVTCSSTNQERGDCTHEWMKWAWTRSAQNRKTQNHRIKYFWIWNPKRGLGFVLTCWRGIHFFREESVYAGERSEVKLAKKMHFVSLNLQEKKKEPFLSYVGNWVQRSESHKYVFIS